MVEDTKTKSNFEESGKGEYSTHLLKKEIDLLKKEIGETKKDTEETKERIKQTTTFMIFVAGGIIIAFFLASIPIFLDYCQNNEQRYEKFIDRTREFYSKEEVSELLKDQQKKFDNFKNCLRDGGWNSCLNSN